jgi:hypothetical protein
MELVRLRTVSARFPRGFGGFGVIACTRRYEFINNTDVLIVLAFHTSLLRATLVVSVVHESYVLN